MTDSPNTGINPYPGLRPFQADETHLFFGRDEQRTELLAALRKSRFLAVVGTSGSGKSSLVRAGLLPGLYGGFMLGGSSHWRVVDTRPGGDPIGRLAKALDKRGVLSDEGEDDDLSFTETTLRRSSLGLSQVIAEARLAEDEKVLVLVDQFEELFRFIDTDRSRTATDDANAYIKLLLAAVQQSDLPIYVVITMRSDFLGDCARFHGLPEAINKGQYLIPRLTREQRRDAITGPASVHGVSLSPTLVNRLLNDVGDVPDQLPILQHALMRTFDHWKELHSDNDTINIEDYEEIGGMSQALSLHADTILRELTDYHSVEAGSRRLKIAESLFKCLTDVGEGGRKIRRLAKLKEIAGVTNAEISEVTAIVDAFRQASNSLLMPPISETIGPETFIDISHESLIRNWGTLKHWVDEENASADIYKRLAQKAVLHRKGEEDLLGGQALAVALRWQEDNQPTATWAARYNRVYQTAMDYLAKSSRDFSAKRSERVRNRRRKRAIIAGFALAAVAPILFYLFNLGIEAERDAKYEQQQYLIQNGLDDQLLKEVYNIGFSQDCKTTNLNQQATTIRRKLAVMRLHDVYSHTEITERFLEGLLKSKDAANLDSKVLDCQFSSYPDEWLRGLLTQLYEGPQNNTDDAVAQLEQFREQAGDTDKRNALHTPNMYQSHTFVAGKAIYTVKGRHEQNRLREIINETKQQAELGQQLENLLSGEFVGGCTLAGECWEWFEAADESDDFQLIDEPTETIESEPDQQQGEPYPGTNESSIESNRYYGIGVDQLLKDISLNELETEFENTQSLDQQHRIAFAWVAKNLQENLDQPDSFSKIRNSSIGQFFLVTDDNRGRAWMVQRLLTRLPYFDDTVLLIKEWSYLILVLLVWPGWLLWRRVAARRGKVFTAKVSRVRPAFASLCDIFIGAVLAVATSASATAFVLLPVAIAFGSFQRLEDTFWWLFIVTGVMGFIGYLLFRDATQFRFSRSFGKVLFEIRPVRKNSEAITMKISAMRNWPIFLLIAVLYPGLILTAVFGYAGNSSVVEAISLVVLIVFIPSLMLIEMLGGFLSKTLVIDVRSAESEEREAIDNERATEAIKSGDAINTFLSW